MKLFDKVEKEVYFILGMLSMECDAFLYSETPWAAFGISTRENIFKSMSKVPSIILSDDIKISR